MYDTPPPFFCPLDFSRCVETGRSGVVIRCWVCAFAFAQWFFVFFLPIWTIFWDFVYRKLICDPLVCVQHLAWPPRGPFVSNGHLPTVWPAYSDPLFFSSPFSCLHIGRQEVGHCWDTSLKLPTRRTLRRRRRGERRNGRRSGRRTKPAWGSPCRRTKSTTKNWIGAEEEKQKQRWLLSDPSLWRTPLLPLNTR